MNVFLFQLIFLGCHAVRTYDQEEIEAENLRKSQCQDLTKEINEALNERRQLAIKKIIPMDSTLQNEIKEINLMASIATHEDRIQKVEADIQSLVHYRKNNNANEQHDQLIIDKMKYQGYLINQNKRNILTLTSLLDNDVRKSEKLAVTAFDIDHLKNLSERSRKIKENFKQEYDILVTLRNKHREYNEKDCSDEINQADQLYVFLKELDAFNDFIDICNLLWRWICILQKEERQMKEGLTHFKNIKSLQDFQTKVKTDATYLAFLKSFPILRDITLEDLKFLGPEVEGKNGSQIVEYIFDQARECHRQMVVAQLKTAVCTFKSEKLEKKVSSAAELLREAKATLEKRVRQTQTILRCGLGVYVQ